MQKLSLKTLIRTLSEAASFADERLCRDWADALLKTKNEGLPLSPPPPLRISGMRVSFSAQVTESERLEFQEGGEDLQLDFSKPDGKFKGEIIFSPYGPEAAYRADDMHGGDMPDEDVPSDMNVLRDV